MAPKAGTIHCLTLTVELFGIFFGGGDHAHAIPWGQCSLIGWPHSCHDVRITRQCVPTRRMALWRCGLPPPVVWSQWLNNRSQITVMLTVFSGEIVIRRRTVFLLPLVMCLQCKLHLNCNHEHRSMMTIMLILLKTCGFSSKTFHDIRSITTFMLIRFSDTIGFPSRTLHEIRLMMTIMLIRFSNNCILE
jgi:hypothetical protein